MKVPLQNIGEHVENVATWNPNKEIPNEEISYIDLSSVDKEKKQLVPELISTIKAKTAPSRARQKVIPGDILVSTVRPNLNGVAIVKGDYKNATASTGYCVLRTRESLHKNYLFYWLLTNSFIDDMVKRATGANYPAVSDRIIKKSQIPLPPLPEQKKIASILDAADAYRQKTKALLTKYDELTQSLFLEMFGDPFFGNVQPLKENINITGGYAFKSSDFVDSGIPLIKIGTVNKGYFDIKSFSFLPEDFLSKYQKWFIEPGDMLMSLTGTVGKDDYGNIELATSDYSSYFLNQRVAKIEASNSTYLKDFLFGMLSHEKCKREVTKISRGVRQANISNKDIENLEMIIPPLKDQKKYIAGIQIIEKQKAQAQQSLEKAEELFQSLLQRAFSGSAF